MTEVMFAAFTGPTSLKRPAEKGLTRKTFTLILNMCADNNPLPEMGRAVNI